MVKNCLSLCKLLDWCTTFENNELGLKNYLYIEEKLWRLNLFKRNSKNL